MTRARDATARRPESAGHLLGVPGGTPARPVRRGEEGSATVQVLVLLAVVTAVAVAGSMVGGLLVGQRRAASAADLAALAAAAALGPGAGPAVGGAAACREAGRVGAANRARVTDCLVQGQEVVVAVVVDVPGLLGRSWQVPGRARAGPATASGGLAP